MDVNPPPSRICPFVIVYWRKVQSMGYLLAYFSYRKLSYSTVNGLLYLNLWLQMAKNDNSGGNSLGGGFSANFGQNGQISVKNCQKKVLKTIFMSEK